MNTGEGRPVSPYRRVFQGNILALGFVSFFTDVASEMVYPLLPVFLAGLATPEAAAIYIGLMDGIAETTSSLMKIVSGRWSDRWARRKPWAVAGYALSTAVRPLMALASSGLHVVGLRFLDRIGKGLRTAPRDALLAEMIDPDVRGLAFSFHRMMDHAGAVTGPVLALVFLYGVTGQVSLWRTESGTDPATTTAVRGLFAVSLIPGLLAVVTLWLKVRERTVRDTRPEHEAPLAAGTGPLPRRFYVFLGAVTLFALGNSSDLFLIFYAQRRFGLGLGYALAMWVGLHLVKIAFSLPGGRFSDRYGRPKAIGIGWLIYAAVYAAMPFAADTWQVWTLLAVYGLYYGMTEGAERAWVADLIPASARGRAYGLYHAAVALAALPASLVFGLVFAWVGPAPAFLLGSVLALAASGLLAWMTRD